ncbi:hypothetical protein Hypma_003166 [Hypsizygus marmoreus]|uniref:Uncharacterized protein n=1 Tax=Hypsizygus marmoreus TaxID=39966 RepID=A0A369K231_HYPMA|nr:hypothetical protein Hypma_003166 [Hypsizygus marmoreus]
MSLTMGRALRKVNSSPPRTRRTNHSKTLHSGGPPSRGLSGWHTKASFHPTWRARLAWTCSFARRGGLAVEIWDLGWERRCHSRLGRQAKATGHWYSDGKQLAVIWGVSGRWEAALSGWKVVGEERSGGWRSFVDCEPVTPPTLPNLDLSGNLPEPAEWLPLTKKIISRLRIKVEGGISKVTRGSVDKSEQT